MSKYFLLISVLLTFPLYGMKPENWERSGSVVVYKEESYFSKDPVAIKSLNNAGKRINVSEKDILFHKSPDTTIPLEPFKELITRKKNHFFEILSLENGNSLYNRPTPNVVMHHIDEVRFLKDFLLLDLITKKNSVVCCSQSTSSLLNDREDQDSFNADESSSSNDDSGSLSDLIVMHCSLFDDFYALELGAKK